MISPLASVHPNAKLGSDVTIDPFAVIQENVTIGDGTHIMSGAVILPYSTIGKNCTIFPGAVIGAIPQDLKFVGEETTVEIGDYTNIRDRTADERDNESQEDQVLIKEVKVLSRL